MDDVAYYDVVGRALASARRVAALVGGADGLEGLDALLEETARREAAARWGAAPPVLTGPGEACRGR